jgi:acetyl esterase/lipase
LTDVSIYPTQLDAFIAAYRYLLSLDIPPDRIVFMGDSAGGGLSVLCGLRLQNLALPQPVSYILLSPWLDHSGENFEGGCPMVETDYLIYANEMVPHFSRLWCGPYPGDAPDVNPLYLPPEAVSGLSPQLVLVGAAEFAVHESVSWGKLCERAGVRCRVVREWGMMHIYALGSLWLPYEVRTRTVETIVDWIESSMNNGSQHNGAYKLVDA